jgi:cellulose synthase/poly-beta-1,6-N-acetylglucosamine synthase-like glycosyltransferase
MIAMWSQVLLLCAVALFAYPFVIYPALLFLIVRRRHTEPLDGGDSGELPDIALIICALNEQKVIREKLENSLRLAYPPGKLHIVVISDGSTDATAAIAREYISSGIQLIEREKRRGKVANLNEVVASRPEEIVALSDANVIYDSKALLHLVRRFQDPQVGCVSGKVVLLDTTAELQKSEETYYSLEWRLQEYASLLHSMAGADGAMYAFRRRLFRPCPNDTLIEDFIIPMNIIRQGSRVVFQPAALAWESGVTSLHEEFRRKTRIAAGAAQGLIRGNAWPAAAPLAVWFVFISHKLLRWLSPLIAVTAVLLALVFGDHMLSRVVLAGTFLLVAAALLRVATASRHFFLDAPFYFLFGQIALLWGLIKGVAGKQSVLWAKQDR